MQRAQNEAPPKLLPLDAKQAEKYLAISRAFEARLDKLYRRAPDDEEMPDFSSQTQNWDESELLAEGLKLEGAAVCFSAFSAMLAASAEPLHPGNTGTQFLSKYYAT